MARTINETTKKPTGLSIKRKGNVFTFSWKKNDSNYSDGQQLQFSIQKDSKGWTDWTSISVGSNITTKAHEVNFGNYNPASSSIMKGIRFRVRGKRENKNGSERYYDKKDKKYKTRDTVTKYAWSDWSDKKMTLKKPNAPSTSADWDENIVTRTKFDWDVKTDETSKRVFRRVDWEAILVKNSTTTNGKKAGKWNSSNIDYRHGTSTDPTSSTLINEDSTRLANGNSYTRWFRVKSRGPRGNTKEAYSYHRYAKPNQAEISEATATKTSAGTTRVYVKWKTTTSKGARPVNKTVVQWIIATPINAALDPPSEGWDDAEGPIKDTNGNAALAFVIDDQPGADEVLFVRVLNYHDNKISYSVPWIPDGGFGYLKTPSIDDINVNTSTHQAEIQISTECEVPGSKIAVLFKTSDQKNEEAIIIGVFGEAGTYNVQAPDWESATPKFGVRGYYGTADEIDGDITTYEFPDPSMVSGYSWDGGDTPSVPGDVKETHTVTSGEGSITLTWSRTWSESDGTQIAWADHQDAWESTDPPETYDIPGIYANKWTISGLETGKTWFVRVRLSKGAGDNKRYGDWSDIIPVSLSTTPNIPALQLSEDTITPDGSVRASWAYVSEDGVPQASANLCYATYEGENTEPTYSDPFLTVTGAQYVTLDAKALEWEAGETYNICVSVTSNAGQSSEGWSAPVPIHVAEPPTITVNSTSFEEVTVTDDAAQQITETVTALTDLPFTANITGAGEGGRTTIAMVRTEPFFVERPDEQNLNGFEGETVASQEMTGEGNISIALADLVGRLDDGAGYKLVAEVTDTYGQTARAEIEFRVIWSHQAEAPGCAVAMDYEHEAAILTPVAPDNYEEGDVCDIYRLSADKPELIYKDAEFGETYVDPFPAFGEHGGHRIVTRTANGDYTTDDGIAWTDFRANAGDFIHSIAGRISWDGGSVPLMYDVDLSNEWKKDFTETKYLGGSIQGDWNVGVSRTGTINTDLINLLDEDLVEAWRRLANYSGLCHIRTVDGSSFNADVQVSESRPHDNAGVYTSFTVTFTRVDPEGQDGLTYDEWEQTIE